MCTTKAEVNGRIIFIITNTEGERDQIYHLGSFKFFPQKIYPTFVQDPPLRTCQLDVLLRVLATLN